MFEFIDKENIRKKAKLKRERYGYLKEKALKLVPWINEKLEEAKFRDITARAKDIAKELGLENKSDTTLYSGLRFLLFFEGIDVSIKNNGKENFFEMKKLEGTRGEGFPPSILNTFDNLELDGWYIKRDYNYLKIRHNIKKDYNKDTRTEIYILESEGDIYFDRRNFTEEQALEFVKYMSGKDVRAPDVIYNTPINIVLNEEYLANRRYFEIEFDLDKVGTEFRIVRGAGDEFTVTSIYGKECNVFEYDIDEVIKGCSIYSIMRNFNRATMIEKVPGRIDVLKKIIPEIRAQGKNAVMIDGKKLIISNSTGTFHLSLLDGTLHKIYDNRDNVRNRNKYICVGPIYNGKENLIIYNGVKYELDRTTGAILSKTLMLLEEKYPDRLTETQVKT